MKKVLFLVVVIVGLAFVGLAALYWWTPAGELPAFLPGFKEGSTHPHAKHALAMLIVGLGAFSLAWLIKSTK